MKIDIKTTNIQLTAEVQNYLYKKIGDLDKFLEQTDFPIRARVELGRTTYHHKSGNIFRAEINLQVPGRLLRAEAERESIFLAIDELKDEIKNELKQYKESQITKTRQAGRLRKLLTAYSPLSWFKGKSFPDQDQ